MKFDTKGSGSLVLIFIIIVLAFIAYGIFKNGAVAPGETEMVEESDSDEETISSSSQSQTNETTETELATEETTDLGDLEEETETLESDLNDLMFEDLGFE